MNTDNEREPAAPAVADPTSPGATPAKAGMARSTKVLAVVAGGVLAAGAVFGGGVAFGTSLNTGAASTAQQGRFGGTPPSGTTGTGGNGTGTTPNGTAPTGAPGGAAPGGSTTTG